MMTYNDFVFVLSVTFSKKVVKRAVIVAIIVGTLLAFINHGDRIISGDVTTDCWIKMIATCFVPFTVSMLTAALTVLEARKLAN